MSDQVSAVIKDTNRGVEKGVDRIKGLGTGFSEIMKRSEEIRTMIADNSRALEDVSRAHTDIQDGLAGVDTLIRSILEVSHDMRQMTDRLAAAFSWFGETLKLQGGVDGDRHAGRRAVPADAGCRGDRGYHRKHCGGRSGGIGRAGRHSRSRGSRREPARMIARHG